MRLLHPYPGVNPSLMISRYAFFIHIGT
jgi:hypothetical protein